MPRSIKDKYLLYHLTSLENIESILTRGLLPRNDVPGFDDVADPEIIDFRAQHGLNQYVPFHFFTKNPFDGRVQKDHPAKKFIYISVTRKFAQQNDFLIIPMHPIAMNPLLLYDYNEGINIIDWTTMELTEYADTYCRHVCMAESLCEFPILSSNFSHIFVKDDETKGDIERLARRILGSYSFNVNTNARMFVSG